MHIYRSLICYPIINVVLPRPQSAIVYAMENIYSNLLMNRENGLYTCSIILDLSKAFDTVKRGILLQKLQFYFGIKGVLLQLFSNCLLIRRQHVINRNTKSCLKHFLWCPTRICFRATSLYYVHKWLAKLFIQHSPLYYNLVIYTFVYLTKI